MAITLVQAVTAKVGGPNESISCSSTGAGNLLVLLAGDGQYSVDTVYTGPSGWTSFASLSTNVYTFITSAVWYYPNNPGGITSVTVTATNATSPNNAGTLTLLEFSGVDTSASPIDASNYANASGYGTSYTANLTTNVAGDLLLPLFVVDEANGTNTYTIDGTYTQAVAPVHDNSGFVGAVAAYKIGGAAGSESYTLSWTNNLDYSYYFLAFKAAGSGGTTGNPAAAGASIALASSANPASASTSLALLQQANPATAGAQAALLETGLSQEAGATVALQTQANTIDAGAKVALFAGGNTIAAGAHLALLASGLSQSAATSLALQAVSQGAVAGASLSLTGGLTTTITAGAHVSLLSPANPASAIARLALLQSGLGGAAGASFALARTLGQSAGASIALLGQGIQAAAATVSLSGAGIPVAGASIALQALGLTAAAGTRLALLTAGLEVAAGASLSLATYVPPGYFPPQKALTSVLLDGPLALLLTLQEVGPLATSVSLQLGPEALSSLLQDAGPLATTLALLNGPIALTLSLEEAGPLAIMVLLRENQTILTIGFRAI